MCVCVCVRVRAQALCVVCSLCYLFRAFQGHGYACSNGIVTATDVVAQTMMCFWQTPTLQAAEFYSEWRSPSREKERHIHTRRTDSERGLERVGR